MKAYSIIIALLLLVFAVHAVDLDDRIDDLFEIGDFYNDGSWIANGYYDYYEDEFIDLMAYAAATVITVQMGWYKPEQASVLNIFRDVTLFEAEVYDDYLEEDYNIYVEIYDILDNLNIKAYNKESWDSLYDKIFAYIQRQLD